MSKTNAKTAVAAAEKLVALKAKKADAKPEAKVLDLKAKLKDKAKKSEGVSCITNPKEREKLARYGIEVLVVNDPDLGEQAAEVRVDGDLVRVMQADRADAVAIAMGLYSHIKKMAEKLAKQMRSEE